MAISITRAKAAKESSAIEKAKRGPPSNSESTACSTKESSMAKPSERQIPSYYKAKTSERQMPSYVKPKTSSRSESQSKSLKHLKSDASSSQKPSANRRPSIVKPASNSKPKAKELSSSRPHKPLVSHGSPHKTPLLLPTTSTPSPTKTTISSKPISKKTSKTPMAAKPKPIWSKKGANPKKTAPTTKKKVAYAPVNSANTPQSSDAKAETSRLETVTPVTQEEGGKVSEIPPHVDSTEQHEQQHKVEPDQPQIQADDEREIPRAPEGEPVAVTEAEEAKGEPKEEKTKDEHGEEESTSHRESNNWRHAEKQPAPDGYVEVKEKGKEEGGVIEDEESENNNEGKTSKEETGTREDKTDSDELVPKSGVGEVKTESTPPKEEAGNESQACVCYRREASKLLETRKNKVLALAGAFQSVIDHQTSSK